MTSIDTTRLSTGSGLIARLYAVLHNIRALNDAHKTRQALQRLTEHELDDIGLCRGDIDRVCRPDFF